MKIWNTKKWGLLFKTIVWFVLISFGSETLGLHATVYAQDYLHSLPAPGKKVNLSSAHIPVLIKGIKTYADNPFRFDFFIDPGSDKPDRSKIEKESQKLIKYFLAALTVPENEMWVNLSPDEQDRVTTAAFGITEMGRDLLAQDYLLKQISASLLDPASKQGEEYWKHLYQSSRLDRSSISNLSKVWIVPDSAEVYTKSDSAFVVSSRLKVMMQEDYFSLRSQNSTQKAVAKNDSAKIFGEQILPIIEKDVNEGENFELLRQIYHSMVLATWFKRHLRQTVFGQVYVGQNKVSGVDIENKNAKEEIYQQYLAAFKKGVFDFIREDYDEKTEELIPRKYFAGGVDFTNFLGVNSLIYRETSDPYVWNRNVLAVEPFNGQPYYRVSSVVVNPKGVEWYNKMQLQSVVPAEVQGVAAGTLEVNPSSSAVVSVSQRIHQFFTQPSKRRSIAVAMVSGIALLAAAGYSSDANGANFIYNGKQGMVIQIEKGDTLGQIALELKKEQSKIRQAGINLDQPQKLWGPQGAVHVVAKAMGISDINQTLYPKDTFVLPSGLTSSDAQASLTGGVVVNYSGTASGSGHPYLATTQTPSHTIKPRSNVYFFTDNEGSVASLPGRTRESGFAFSEEAEFQNRSYQINPVIPMSLGALLFTGLGLAARQYLVQRSMGANETVEPSPEPPQRPRGGEQQMLGSFKEPVRFGSVKPQSASAELLARHITAMSLPYVYAHTKIRDRIAKVVLQLSQSFAEHVSKESESQQELLSALNQSLSDVLYSACEAYFDFGEMDGLIAKKANELTESWIDSQTSDFDQTAEIDDFVNYELNPLIETKLAASRERLEELLKHEHLSLVYSALEAARQWQNAEGPVKVNPADLAAKVIAEIIDDVKSVFGVEFVMRKTALGFVGIEGAITVEKIKAAFQLNSLEQLALVARFHQASVENAHELATGLEELLVEKLKLNRAEAQAAIERYFDPMMARYWETAFYREYNAEAMDARMQRAAQDLARQASEHSLTAQEINERIADVVKTNINLAIASEVARTVGRVHQEYFTENLRSLYTASMTTAIEMQNAMANGSPIDMAQTVQQVGERVAEIFKDQFNLAPLPLLVQGASLALAEDQATQELEGESTAHETIGPRAGRVKGKSFAVADLMILLTTATVMVSTGNTDSQGVLTTLVSPFMFRAGLAGSLWLHEFSHIFAGGRKALSRANLLANIPIKDWFSMLLPLTGTVATDLHVKIPNVRKIHAWIIRMTGILSSVVLALGAVIGVRHLLGDGHDSALLAVMPLLTSTIMVAMAAIKSDFWDPLRGKACEGEFNCGVAIVLTKREEEDKGIVGERAQKIFQRMGRVTDIRGQQAAGSFSLGVDKKGRLTWVGHRMVNSKRGDLPEKLNNAYTVKTKLKNTLGYVGSGVSLIFGHYRFGTSSAPKASETHPHQWLPDRNVKQWIVQDGIVQEQDAILGIKIVHNGDFDDWLMNGVYQNNGDISYWLSNVLQQADVTSGDSPKIAGMMDYLVTKGIWEASVRYGYYETMAPDFNDVFGGKFEKVVEKTTPEGTPIYKVVSPNTALTNEQIAQVSQRLREVFLREAMGLLEETDTDLSDFIPKAQGGVQDQKRKEKLDALKRDMFENLAGLPLTQNWTKDQRQKFIDVTVSAFLENDEYRAAQIFISRAKGSFGLGIGSTLKPDGVILVADGQPLALGFDEARNHLLIASEPSALKVPVNPDGDKTLDYRLTLRQNPGKGEIVNITHGTDMAIYSRELERELTPEEIKNRTVSLHRNPYVTSLPELGRDDPIGDDIQDTALIMDKIKNSWSDPTSFNRQTEQNIFRHMLQKYIAKQIMALSQDYIGMNASLHEQSREMTTQVGIRLIGELNDSVQPDKNWASRLNLPEALTGFSQYVDGAFDQVFDRAYIRSQILAEANQVVEMVMSEAITENGIKSRIDDFVQGALKTSILQEKQRAQAEVEQLLARWFGVLRAELILQVRKSLVSRDTQSVSQASQRAFENVAIHWKRAGMSSGFRPAPQSPDMVVTGIEISQWMGEQFVQDLKRVFPGLEVKAVSANKILADPDAEGIDDETIVLAISQSGQTFPTLNSSILLETLAPGRVFVLTGEWDTLMGQAVGQEFQPDSPFSGRIISNLTGFRPAEAVSLTGTATHATLTELLLSLGKDFLQAMPTSQPLGLTLSISDFEKLSQKRDESIKELEAITAFNRGGQPVVTAENKAIQLQAKKWARHVLDAPLSKVFTTIHLFVAVVGGFLLFPFLAQLFSLTLALPLVALAQYFFFEFFQYSTVLAMRAIQGRVPLARTGKRTIVVGDRPYIHQSLEMFLTKMNSLSKSAVAIDVHGGNPSDHFVHRFGHRVVRGTLLWLGVPDGRLNEKLGQVQSSVAMTGKQAKGVRNFGVGAEVVTVGKSRSFNKNASDVDLTIPGDAVPVGENLAQLFEDRFDSLSRLVSGQVLFHSMQRRVASLGLPATGRWLWPWSWKIHRTQSGPRIATTASPTSAASLTREFKQRIAPLPLGLRPRTGYVAPVTNQQQAQTQEQQTSSSVNSVGGIDLNPNSLKLNETGKAASSLAPILPFVIDPKMIQGMPGDQFVPMIIEVVPVKNVDMFLGMADRSPTLSAISQ